MATIMSCLCARGHLIKTPPLPLSHTHTSKLPREECAVGVWGVGGYTMWDVKDVAVKRWDANHPEWFVWCGRPSGEGGVISGGWDSRACELCQTQTDCSMRSPNWNSTIFVRRCWSANFDQFTLSLHRSDFTRIYLFIHSLCSCCD